MKSLKILVAIALFFGTFSSSAQTTLNVCNGLSECQMVVKLEIKNTSSPCSDTFTVYHAVGVLDCQPFTIPDTYEFVSATLMNGADMIPLMTIQPPVPACDFGYSTSETVIGSCGGNTITATWMPGGITIMY